MRQRSVDVNQTTLFVDTQPRPVNRGPVRKRAHFKPQGGGWPDGGGGGGDQMTEARAWSLLAVAVMLLLAGTYLARGNQYAHLHRKIQDSYYEYLQAWDHNVRAAFAATTWELHVQGRDRPLPLELRTLPSKRVLVPKTAAGSGSGSEAASGQAQPDGANAAAADGEREGGQQQEQARGQGSSSRRWRRIAAQSTLLEFRVHGLMEALQPTHVPPADRHRATHARLWRPAGQELRRPVAMWLRATDTRTGVVSVVELGPVVFTRETTVPAAGEGRCVYEQSGVWQRDGTCTVQEYLWGLCVKVAQDAASGGFAADASTGGGPGCGPEWGWQLGQWRRLDARRNSINGRVYLPLTARNATVVTVRHGRDPAVLESALVRRLSPNVDQQILFHAVGLAMCFLGLVLLLSVGAFAAPALLRRARAVWDGMRGRQQHRRHGCDDAGTTERFDGSDKETDNEEAF